MGQVTPWNCFLLTVKIDLPEYLTKIDSNKIPTMYTITGKIVVKENGQPVADIIVRLSGKPANLKAEDSSNNYSLASTLSDAAGNFKLSAETGSFEKLSKGQTAFSFFLIAEAPEDISDKTNRKENRELYISKPLNIGSNGSESVMIRISQSLLEKHGLEKSTIALTDLNAIAKINKEKYSGIKTITKQIDQKVENSFRNFLSSASDKNLPNYYSESNSKPLQAIQAGLMDQGLQKIPASKLNRRFSIRVSAETLERMGVPPAGTATIDVQTIIGTLFPGSTIEIAKKKCLRQITEEDIFPTASATPSPSLPATDAPSTNGQGISHEQLMQFASNLISTTTSPETALQYKKIVDPSYGSEKVCDTLSGLSVCGGPADITSYHDFQTLQIAFEHIWTEVFDQELKQLGKTLYSEVVKLEEGFSAPPQPTARPVVVSAAPAGPAVAVPAYVTPAGAVTAYATGGGTVVVSPVAGGNTVTVTPALPVVPSRPDEINSIHDLRNFIQQFRVPGMQIPANVMDLVNELDRKLTERHKFDVFAPGSINYGLLYTFRQKWEPVNYQVGRLISSLPLAPKESRKYSIKTVKVLSRNQKMLDDQEYKSHSESSMTSRAETEIINRAQNKTSFNLSASASYNAGAFGAQLQTQLGTEAENLSSETKKNFREAVSKASQDFRKQNKTEIEISSKLEQEVNSSSEIMNPNDEIPVTFLFYELQRQYDLSEELYKLQPVILVANEVPSPHEINNQWLITNAWILQKVMLDPIFLPAIYYLSENGLSGTLTLQILRDNLSKQIYLVQSLSAEANLKTAQAQQAFDTLLRVIRKDDMVSSLDTNQLNNAMHALSAVLNPIGAIAGAIAQNQSEEERFKRMKEAASMLLERQDKEKSEFADRLKNEVSALERMTMQYVDEMKRVMDREQALTQLRIHVKENILYYMQAIWDHEPPDQRFFRLYNIEIDWLEPAEERAAISPSERAYGDTYIEISMDYRCRQVKKRLVEVADVDNVLGYKGNYMVFAAKKRSHLHNYMMHDFIDEYSGGLKDPDGFSQYTAQELIDYLRCLKQNNARQYESEKAKIIEILNEKQKSPRKEKERIVLPTSSVYIEALPGKHAILEDFKLVHRALDVKKVQAELRKMELENLRYASRLGKDLLGDPDFEKQVLINKADNDIDVSDG